MNNLTADYIAIDTNVFVQLFNTQENEDGHINRLLSTLQDDGIAFLIDEPVQNKPSKIRDEYCQHLIPQILASDEQSNERQLIKGLLFADQERLEQVPVDMKCPLGRAIINVLHQAGNVDKIFVYVAFKKGRILITNDRKDLIDRRHGDGKRRRELLDKTEKCRSPGREDKADILCSQEAHDKL